MSVRGALDAFLRNQRRRAEPSSRWQVWRLPSGGPGDLRWARVTGIDGTAEAAWAEVAALRPPDVAPFDVLRLLPVGDTRATRMHGFVREGGRVAPLPSVDHEGLWEETSAWARPLGTDWVRAWERCPSGGFFLNLAEHHGFPTDRLDAAALALAAHVVERAPNSATTSFLREQLALWGAPDLAETTQETFQGWHSGVCEHETAIDPASPDLAVRLALTSMGRALVVALLDGTAYDDVADRARAASVALCAPTSDDEVGAYSLYEGHLQMNLLREHVPLTALLLTVVRERL